MIVMLSNADDDDGDGDGLLLVFRLTARQSSPWMGEWAGPRY